MRKAVREIGIIPLSKQMLICSSLPEMLANQEVNDITYQITSAKVYSTSIITNRQLHVDLLDRLSSDDDLWRQNSMIARHLSSMLPFASDVPISRILHLREREDDAFVRYCLALTKVVEEASKANRNLTESQARQIYGDIIRPRLAELNQKVNQSKRDLINEPAARVAATAAVVSFGFFSGLLPPELTALFGAAGASKIAYDAVKETVSKSDVRWPIRNDEMYFLWRLAKHSRNS